MRLLNAPELRARLSYDNAAVRYSSRTRWDTQELYVGRHVRSTRFAWSPRVRPSATCPRRTLSNLHLYWLNTYRIRRGHLLLRFTREINATTHGTRVNRVFWTERNHRVTFRRHLFEYSRFCATIPTHRQLISRHSGRFFFFRSENLLILLAYPRNRASYTENQTRDIHRYHSVLLSSTCVVFNTCPLHVIRPRWFYTVQKKNHLITHLSLLV